MLPFRSGPVDPFDGAGKPATGLSLGSASAEQPRRAARTAPPIRDTERSRDLAKFLTAEWLDALATTVNQNEAFAAAIANVDLTLQFEVPDAPEGSEGTYVLAIGDGTLNATAGPTDEPDATITNDYETAVAMSKGELNTQMAFMSGKMKVAGNMAKIMMNMVVFTKFAEAAADVEVEY
jgi:putative sterol carrier protein